MYILETEIISRVLLMIFIYLVCYLSFYIFRDNKYYIISPCISILWLLNLAYNEKIGVWVCSYVIEPPDIIIWIFGSRGLAIAFFITEVIRFTFLSRTKIYTNSNWIQVVVLSFYPILLIINYEYFYEYEFLSFLFIFVIIIDKIITLKYEYFIKQTILKVIIVMILSFLLHNDVPQYIIGDIIILITDCLTGYILLHGKYDVKLRCFLKAMKLRLKNR